MASSVCARRGHGGERERKVTGSGASRKGECRLAGLVTGRGLQWTLFAQEARESSTRTNRRSRERTRP
jgi:hypothetical protein